MVVEAGTGRSLKPSEIVHHIDLDKRNNKPENLFLCKNPAEHARCHNSLDAIAERFGCDGQSVLRMGFAYFDVDGGIYKCETQV
ncbi:MAG: HNH endonuclease [Butyrivibrio sp.]|nr:HNH endonuclease [Butyrivibrio sp.]